MRSISLALALLGCLAFGQAPQHATKDSVQEVQGRVEGDAVKTYPVKGTKGQTIELTLQSPRANWLVLRLYPKGKTEGADVLSNYISGDTTVKGTFPSDGEFIVFVGLRRAEARRAGRATFRLRIASSPK